MATITESIQIEQPVNAEDTRVFHWRIDQFMKLGFSEEMAWILADSDAELSRSRVLVAAGCPLDLVARIML
jgi:hypothetical protein